MKKIGCVSTLKDIKDILNSIPDKYLEVLGFGIGEGSEENVGLMSSEEDYFETFEKIDKKYKGINKIAKLIENISKIDAIMRAGEDDTEKIWENLDDFISDKTDVKKLLKN